MKSSKQKMHSDSSFETLSVSSPPSPWNEDEQDFNHYGEGVELELEHYVRKIDETEAEYNRKFQLLRSKSSFQIEHLPADPEQLLHDLFQKCIDEAVENGRRKGIHPEMIGAVISSPLLDPDIYVPIRRISPNTVDTILNLFLHVAQSKEEGSLYGQPFTITLTVVDKQRLSLQDHGWLKGAGNRKGRKFAPRLAPVHHNIRQSSLIPVRNINNGYCLFYALQLAKVHASCQMERREFWKYTNRDHRKLRRDVEQLMCDVRAPLGQQFYEAERFVPRVVNLWNQSSRHSRFKVFIFGDMGHYAPKYKYGPEEYNVPVILYHHNNHFDAVRRIAGFFRANNYCLSCESPYKDQREHKAHCKKHCLYCGRVGSRYPCKRDDPAFLRVCSKCNKQFMNLDCYKYHLSTEFCKKSQQCKECEKIWLTKDNCRDGRKGHVCGENYCQLCTQYHKKERGCFIQTIKPRAKPVYRCVSFDFESMQHEVVKSNHQHPPRRNHRVNFAAAYIYCSSCLENGRWKESLKDAAEPCQICGPHRTVTFGHCSNRNTAVDKHYICDNPLAKFVDWIVYRLPKKYETVAFSHYGGKFDVVLLSVEIYKRGINPQMIRKANKIYMMEVPAVEGENGRITFKDSFNLLPTSLDSLIGAFDLKDVQHKPFFAYLANRPELYNVKINGLPPPEDYCYGGMSVEKKKRFDEWYRVESSKEGACFELPEQLASYCQNDTKILSSALAAFRAEFLEISKRLSGFRPPSPPPTEDPGDGSAVDLMDCDGDVEPSLLSANQQSGSSAHPGLDILYEAITISNAAMLHFKLNHLKSNHLGIVPSNGYDFNDGQSHLALQYFHFLAKTTGMEIETAHHVGEKKFGPYSVDGYCPETDMVIEVYGDVWHACPRHFPSDQTMLPKGKTAGMIRKKDGEREQYIRQRCSGFKVVWECEIREQLQKSEEMRRLFAEFDFQEGSPLNLRSAFFGGRCAPLKLFHKAGPDESLAYVDFVSLYPASMFKTAFPVGHPKTHKFFGKQREVDWRRPEDCSWRGFLKCFVIPPRKCSVPVLPVRIAEKLQFPLCARCCLNYPEGSINPKYRCPHSQEQRGWISTCTSIELQEALRVGYRVTKLFRVLEYEKWDDQLFKEYIREFATLKIHSSGFPPECKTVEQRELFIMECLDLFAIEIEEGKMIMDKAKRTIAKFFLNQLWGKFSMRSGMSQTEICDSPARLRQLLDDNTVQVITIDELTPDAILITYEPAGMEFVDEHSAANVAISAWTTSAARIMLLKAMQKVADCPGATLLYTDTDSLIYCHKKDHNPLQTGWHLGQLANEFPHHNILEFVSGGCKQYGLKLCKKDGPADQFEYVLKVRGISLNHDNCQLLNYQTFKRKVFLFASGHQPEPIILNYPRAIRPDVRKGRVTSVDMKKFYSPVVTKGIIGKDFTIRDFGFK